LVQDVNTIPDELLEPLTEAYCFFFVQFFEFMHHVNPVQHMMQMLSTLLQISIAESSLLKQFSDGFSV
jgi:hypothetical protein